MTEVKKWDDPTNEATNSFIVWGAIGDFILGTLIGVKETESTLPGKEGTKQKIYEIKVAECVYHTINEDKTVSDKPTTADVGDVVSVGGRAAIDSRMSRVVLGQKVGLKFVETIKAEKKGYSDFKSIKVFLPKDAQGQLLMDESWILEHDKSNF